MNNFRKIESKQEWQRLLHQALFMTFFHKLEWESFLEKEFKWLKFKRYVWQNRGEDQALLSLARYSRGGKEYLVSHPFCEYGGPLPLVNNSTLNNSTSDVELFDLGKFYEDLRAQFGGQGFKIKFHPNIVEFFNNSTSDVKLLGTGIETYFIEDFDKKTKEDIFSDFRKTLRHSITKSQSAGLKIKKCQNKQELAQFYNLVLAKAKEHQAPALPISVYNFFLNSADAEIILAFKDNSVAAGSVFLFYDKRAHYFKNASSRKGGALGANHLILWETIKKYCHGQSGRGNLKVFDFGGTRVGSSLETFKKGWGAQVKPIYVLGDSANLAALESGLSLSRKIWGLLPKTAIKILSPYFLKYKL